MANKRQLFASGGRIMTKEERIKILEMVAAGRLSVEQANKLMDILSAKSTTDTEKRLEEGLRTDEYTQEAMGRIRGYGKTLDRGLRAVGLKWDKPHDAGTDYVKALRGTGLVELTTDELATLKMNGVSANYVKSLREAGLGDLKTDQIITLKSCGINADYVKALREAGLVELTADELATLKMNGVSANYVKSLCEAGLGDLKTDQIITLKSCEISANYVRELREAGLDVLSVDQIIALKYSGVSAGYVRDFARNRMKSSDDETIFSNEES